MSLTTTSNAEQSRIPDFYVIGASKCGTTALSDYLRRHPNVCFARTKEPHFFAEDRPTQRADLTLEEYWRRNFSYYNPTKHLITGEGSGTYYTSNVAIPRILQLNPSAKFIYMVRNPVDMVHSWYNDLRYSSSEELELEDAWDLQNIRAQGKSIPKFCPDPFILQYRALASLGSRLEFLKGVIPPEQLKVILLDDFSRDTRAVYEGTLKFLNLPSDGRSEFPLVNGSKAPRSLLLSRISASYPRWLYNGVREFKHLTGLNHIQLNVIAKLNSKPAPKTPLSSPFRQRLQTEFEPEIQLLERLLDRDLSHWRLGQQIAGT